MRKPLLSFHATSFLLSLFLFSCDQNIDQSGNLPEILYTVAVSDSLTGAPLDSVYITAKTAFGDSVTGITTLPEGNAVLPAIVGTNFLFSIYRNGYLPDEFLDSIPVQPGSDTGVVKPQLRLITVRLSKFLPGGNSPAELLSGPPDTIGQNDTLHFSFSERVAQVVSIRVGLINVQSTLTVNSSFDAAGENLSVSFFNDTLQVGKLYDYDLTLRDSAGFYFTRIGDTATSITGTFRVRDTSKTN